MDRFKSTGQSVRRGFLQDLREVQRLKGLDRRLRQRAREPEHHESSNGARYFILALRGRPARSSEATA